jgi:hypothetical protein
VHHKTKEELKNYIFSIYKLGETSNINVELMIEVELSIANIKKADDLFIKLTNKGTNTIICP